MFDGQHSQFPVLYSLWDFSKVQILFCLLLMAEVLALHCKINAIESSCFQDSNVQALCFISEAASIK